jgi:hypothetical protein
LYYFSSEFSKTKEEFSDTLLEKIRPKNFVCRLSALFREDLSQRFAAYLSRIGLPEIAQPAPAAPAQTSTSVPI